MDKLRRVLNGNDIDDEGQGFVPMPVNIENVWPNLYN